MRRALIGAALSATALAGCDSAWSACPAIGHLHTLIVEPEDPEAIGRLELSSELADSCGTVELAGGDGTTPSPSAAGEPCPATQLAREGDRWRIEGLPTAPERLELSVYDPSGLLTDTRPVTPEWRRTGGTERCGGPQEGIVHLDGARGR